MMEIHARTAKNRRLTGNFPGFPIFYKDFLYFRMFCYIFLGFPINGHPHMFDVMCMLRRFGGGFRAVCWYVFGKYLADVRDYFGTLLDSV